MSLLADGLSCRACGRDILNGVSLEVRPGQVVSVVGPNGAGKTTLLRCMQGMVRPSAGSVAVGGRDVLRMRPRELARHLAYVPQAGPGTMALTVFDLVLAGRRPHLGWRPSPRDLEAVEAILDDFGLTALAARDVDVLSGGQRQKVFLARAFVQEPRYLLLDEPTSSLDLRHQLEVMELLRRQAAARGVGALVAIHDLNLARRYADRAVLLHCGEVVAGGEPAHVMTPEAIRAVYGVEVECVPVNGGSAVFALRPVSEGEREEHMEESTCDGLH